MIKFQICTYLVALTAREFGLTIVEEEDRVAIIMTSVSQIR